MPSSDDVFSLTTAQVVEASVAPYSPPKTTLTRKAVTTTKLSPLPVSNHLPYVTFLMKRGNRGKRKRVQMRFGNRLNAFASGLWLSSDWLFYPLILALPPGDCVWKTMYPFGTDQSDHEAPTGDSYSSRCKKIFGPDFGIPFYNGRHYKLYVRFSSCLQMVTLKMCTCPA